MKLPLTNPYLILLPLVGAYGFTIEALWVSPEEKLKTLVFWARGYLKLRKPNRKWVFLNNKFCLDLPNRKPNLPVERFSMQGYGKFVLDSDQHGSLGGLKPGCEVKFEKVGCFKDNVGTRALPELIFDQRGDISWKLDKWEDYLKQLACKCAKRTDDSGYSHFGLQFYAECWTGLKAAERFNIYGKSKDCIGGRYLKCDDRDKGKCVGGAHVNYIYRITPAGGGSGIGPLSD